MLARHTPVSPARMKGSAVAQGLKSLASKLHPQLPLSSRESQRLLNSLTASFRQQLDEAHPRPLGGEGNHMEKPPKANAKQMGTRTLHASAASLADKHLAFILTNPLIAKHEGAKPPVLDYKSANAELDKGVGRDPIALLEEYHQEGAATVDIAVLCLETFLKNLAMMPVDEQQDASAATQAGKRTLVWLSHIQHTQTDFFNYQKKVLPLVVRCMIKEGHETYLWDWLQSGVALKIEKDPQENHGKQKGFKSFLLRSIISAKLKDAPGKSADSALDAFFRAYDYNTSQKNTRNVVPLSKTNHLLITAFQKSPELWSNTDAVLFDRLIAITETYKGATLLKDFHQATLYLVHPHKPTPLPAFQVLKKMLASQPTEDAKTIRDTFKRTDTGMRTLFNIMTRTVAQLQELSRIEDANWLSSEIRQNFPALSVPLGAGSRNVIHARNVSRSRDEHILSQASFPSLVGT